MNVSVPIPGHSYDIVIERGGLNQVGDWLRTLWRAIKKSRLFPITAWLSYMPLS